MAPEHREKPCISVGTQRRGRTLGLEESPPETPLPSPAEDAEQPRTTGKGRTLFSPSLQHQGCRRSPALSNTAPASPAMLSPTSTEPQVPPAGGAGGWCSGRDAVVAQGLVYSGRLCWSSFSGAFQLLSLPQHHGCSVANS